MADGRSERLLDHDQHAGLGLVADRRVQEPDLVGAVDVARVVGAPLRWLRSRAPERGSAKADAIAGIPGAIGSVPDGMAASVLAGVNPIHGLYASLVGPIAGGLSASTRLMVITTTSAAALAAGSALGARPGASAPRRCCCSPSSPAR